MILIVAPGDDLHAQVVRERIRDLGGECTIWNTTWFPWRQRITWRPEAYAVCDGETDFNLEDTTCIWWRRYRRPTAPPNLVDVHVKKFCVGEAAEMMRGFIAASAMRIVNDPIAERKAGYKILQLHLARKLGMAIPATIVSNDQGRLMDFVTHYRSCIIKPLLCDYPHNFPTRQCTSEDFKDAAQAALAPSLVQELVDYRLDIRVCAIGSEMFAAELHRDDGETVPDWRHLPNGWRPHALPEGIRSFIGRMMSELRLDMGSFDFRFTPRGEYVFFEVNPSGQFLFLEVDAGLNVSHALARFLLQQSA